MNQPDIEPDTTGGEVPAAPVKKAASPRQQPVAPGAVPAAQAPDATPEPEAASNELTAPESDAEVPAPPPAPTLTKTAEAAKAKKAKTAKTSPKNKKKKRAKAKAKAKKAKK